jgi:putative endonuclease
VAVGGIRSDTAFLELFSFSNSLSCHPREGGDPDRIDMNKQFYVYIMASKPNGTLYTGMSSNLVQRIWQHKNNMVEGFTDKYNVKHLVYYEVHDSAESAITREKQIKKWRRKWKLRLIEKQNSHWEDLYSKISG